MKILSKNFLHGASTVINIFPETGDKVSELFLTHTDIEALYQDWQSIGEDLGSAVHQYEHAQER